MARPSVRLVSGALQREIAARGLSYEQLADMVGRDRTTIYRLATGARSDATYATACQLLWVLDVRPSALFVLPKLAP